MRSGVFRLGMIGGDQPSLPNCNSPRGGLSGPKRSLLLSRARHQDSKHFRPKAIVQNWRT